MIHLSPSNLAAFEMIDKVKWMTKAKFKLQYLGLDGFSEAAQAGNAVHALLGPPVEPCPACGGVSELTTDTECDVCNKAGYAEECDLCKGHGGDCAAKCADGFLEPEFYIPLETREKFIVSVDLKIKTAKAMTNTVDPTNVAEVSHVMYGKDFGVDIPARLSLRFDLLSKGLTTELKTGENPDMDRYETGAQILTYKVAMEQPVLLLAATIKIKKRGRAAGRRAEIVITDVKERLCKPQSDDRNRLKSLFLRCADHVYSDPEMRAHAMTKTIPDLL